jgi:large subunit ribosomal protein L29
MKAEKIRTLDPAELEREVGEAHEQLFRLRFQMGMGQLEGLKKYRTLKKDRARLLTVLRERNAAEPAIVAAPLPVKAAKTRSAKKKAK